jgi:hypothetical protein
LLIAAYASLTKASIMRIVKYALIISMLLCFFLAPAQDTIPPTPIDYDNNTIYATGGHIIVAASGGLTYERTFFNKTWFTPFLRGGVGYFSDGWGPDSMYSLLGGGTLIGKRDNHIELSSHYILWLNASQLVVGGAVGWRYQSPGGGFVARVGAGWPEMAYVGLGFSF